MLTVLIPYIMALQLLRRMQTKGKKLKKQTVRLLIMVEILVQENMRHQVEVAE